MFLSSVPAFALPAISSGSLSEPLADAVPPLVDGVWSTRGRRWRASARPLEHLRELFGRPSDDSSRRFRPLRTSACPAAPPTCPERKALRRLSRSLRPSRTPQRVRILGGGARGLPPVAAAPDPAEGDRCVRQRPRRVMMPPMVHPGKEVGIKCLSVMGRSVDYSTCDRAERTTAVLMPAARARSRRGGEGSARPLARSKTARIVDEGRGGCRCDKEEAHRSGLRAPGVSRGRAGSSPTARGASRCVRRAGCEREPVVGSEAGGPSWPQKPQRMRATPAKALVGLKPRLGMSRMPWYSAWMPKAVFDWK